MLGSEEETTPHISSNALIGRSTFQTMRVIGHIGKYEIHILVDLGSTHNFIDCEIARKLGCQRNKTCPLQVNVANGNHMGAMRCIEVIRETSIQSAPTVLNPLLEEYVDVFAIPKELPPFRSHDHKIPLKEGTPPINIKPYRHPPIIKDAIESMVQELLESGVIRHNQSSFSYLVVMVNKKDGSWRMCIDYRL
ncbi:reverse transcriptase [Tanacetum coccineum]